MTTGMLGKKRVPDANPYRFAICLQNGPSVVNNYQISPTSALLIFFALYDSHLKLNPHIIRNGYIPSALR